MKITPSKLSGALKQGLSHLYLVGADDPLLVVEAVDAIRAAAQAEGFTEREVLHAEAGFDWNHLRSAGQAMSLFGDKKLIELHLPGSPGKPGGAALTEAAQQASQDTLIMVRCGELDWRQQKAAWFKAIEKDAVVVYGEAPRGEDLLAWVAGRMRRANVQADDAAIAMLAERVEGNLLAAKQDIDKLALLFPDQPVGPEQIAEAVADHARFEVFDLLERVLAGRTAQALRTLNRLQDEGVDAVPIAWHLTTAARVLAGALTGDAASAFKAGRVFGSRQQAYRQAMSRHGAGSAQWLLLAAAKVDRVAKGGEHGDAWAELITLVTVMSTGGQPNSPARGWMRTVTVAPPTP